MSQANHEGGSKIVFLEHNPFMSVELLDLLKDYKIICYNDDETYRFLKRDWNLESYLNTKFDEEPESDKVAETMLGDEAFLSRAIQNKTDSKILFFFMNRRMNEFREKAGIDMLLPPFELQERLGNKRFLSNICQKMFITENKSLSFETIPKDINKLFRVCEESLGAPFIVQDALGESGWDTSLVNSEIELKNALSKIKRELRVTRYISNNIPISVHVCVLEKEIIIRGPWLQLVGLPELSTSPFRFAGNDTNQSLLNKKLIEKVLDLSQSISQFMKNEGYRGILGIDYLWDKNTDQIYPQEINSRLVGLSRLLIGIQKDQGLFPDLLKHITAFGVPSYTEKTNSFHEGSIDFSVNNYSQVIVRNNKFQKVKVKNRLEPGIYKSDKDLLVKTKNSLFVQDMEKDEVLITYAAHKNCQLLSDEVIVRLILKETVIDNSTYKLNNYAKQLVSTIRNQVLIQE